MATKKRKHRRKRSVSAPKHRRKKRRIGSTMHASGKPRRRRRTHHRKGRRVGASQPRGAYKQSAGDAVMELIALTVGGAMGDIGASLGGQMMENAPMNLPPMLIEGAKVVVGGGLFVAGGTGIGKTFFGNIVKGVGLGSAVSGLRGAVKHSGIIPAMGAPENRDMYVVLPPGMGAEKAVIGVGSKQLYPANQMGASKSVIGMANSRLYGEGDPMYAMGF